MRLAEEKIGRLLQMESWRRACSDKLFRVTADLKEIQWTGSMARPMAGDGGLRATCSRYE